MQCFHDNWPKHAKKPLLTKALPVQEEKLRGLKEDVCPCISRHKELCLQEDTTPPRPFPQARGFGSKINRDIPAQPLLLTGLGG